MRVRIRLFARLRELAGTADLERELPAAGTVRGVWQALVQEFPDMSRHTSSVSCAVNEEYARMDAPVQDGDEIAFLPPVSGGSGR